MLFCLKPIISSRRFAFLGIKLNYLSIVFTKNRYIAKLLKNSKFMKLVLEVLQKEGYIKSFTQKEYNLIIDFVYEKNFIFNSYGEKNY